MQETGDALEVWERRTQSEDEAFCGLVLEGMSRRQHFKKKKKTLWCETLFSLLPVTKMRGRLQEHTQSLINISTLSWSVCLFSIPLRFDLQHEIQKSLKHFGCQHKESTSPDTGDLFVLLHIFKARCSSPVGLACAVKTLQAESVPALELVHSRKQEPPSLRSCFIKGFTDAWGRRQTSRLQEL